jgi:16S rRNA (cytosine1407-C5)-methyltransferase
VANEPDIGRLHTLQENLVRMHASNVIYTNLDGLKFGDTMPEIFDCVLLDAPCSGEGTAFKSDDALSHRRIEEIKKIAHLQYKLLESAYHTCKV